MGVHNQIVEGRSNKEESKRERGEKREGNEKRKRENKGKGKEREKEEGGQWFLPQFISVSMVETCWTKE